MCIAKKLLTYNILCLIDTRTIPNYHCSIMIVLLYVRNYVRMYVHLGSLRSSDDIATLFFPRCFLLDVV